MLTKLWANDTFADVAKPYWVRKEGAKIAEWTDKAPSAGTAFLWEERKMIGGGIAFRGSKPQSDTGIDVYKGENIVATELQGAPALTQADLSLVDDKSLWRYSDILPEQGLAVARVAHCPNGVMFDPMTVAFTNTATLLFPRHDCRDVPFDLILMSNIYVWFYALAARMGILRTLRSDVYPTNLAFLPWNQKIAGRAADIESLRNEIVASCHSLLNGVESLRAALDALKFDSLKARLTQDKDTTISWGEHYSDPKHRTLVTEATVVPVEDVWRVQTDTDLFDSVDLNREDLAHGLAVALHTKKGEEMSKSELLNLPIPVTEDEIKQWTTVVSQHQTPQLEKAMVAAIAKLDAILGKCLGLTSSDIKAIQADLETDPFLQGIRPRYPGTVTRKQGFRTGLDAQDRYA